MKLPEDFGKRVFEIFSSEEMSEPLIMVYHYLESLGIKQSGFESDSFRFSQSGLSYMFNSEEILNLPHSFSDPFFDIEKSCFVMVFERDSLVQKLFRLNILNDDSLVVELVKPE